MRLGDLLVERKLITDEQLRISLREQNVTSDRLGEILIRLGFVRRAELSATLVELHATDVLSDDAGLIDTKAVRDILISTRTIVRGDMGSEIYIATLSNDPASVVRQLEEQTGRLVKLAPAPVMEIYERLNAGYDKDGASQQSLVEEEDVNKLIAALLNEALRDNASDIHIEPGECAMHIRFRIDGFLYDQHVFPITKTDRLISRLKDRCGMDVSEKRNPQDGSFSIVWRGKPVDFRVATILTSYGEKMTIRALNKENIMKDIHELGITKIDQWLELARQHNGLILVCGSTGSGKTTTMYSTIQFLDRLHKAIYTIEDPIEYRIPYVCQTQVNRKSTPPFDFAEFTRTVLRHDPEVVIVGEIRDRETAHNTLHLADTGHLVYATLHTNDVPSSISRLLGLGIDKNQLPFLLRGVLVQKLARKLCQNCFGHGCEPCRSTGYKGRTLVTEFVRINDLEAVNRLMTGKEPFHSFEDDAVAKVACGETDCTEISRITGDEIRLCKGRGECIGPKRLCKAESKRQTEQ